MKAKLFDSEAKVMEIIWDKSPISAKEISLIAAEKIGWTKNTTYTVIKKLEAKGLLVRERSKEDERNLFITLTETGEELKDQALHVPAELAKCVELESEETRMLYQLLYKLLQRAAKED